MIRSLHQLPDSASVSVCRSTGVGQDGSLLCEQCGPILVRVWVLTLESQRRSVTPLIKPTICSLGVNWVTKTRNGHHTLCANRVQ